MLYFLFNIICKQLTWIRKDICIFNLEINVVDLSVVIRIFLITCKLSSIYYFLFRRVNLIALILLGIFSNNVVVDVSWILIYFQVYIKFLFFTLMFSLCILKDLILQLHLFNLIDAQLTTSLHLLLTIIFISLILFKVPFHFLCLF